MEKSEAEKLFGRLHPVLLTMQGEIGAIGMQEDGSLIVILIKSSEEICKQVASRIHEIEPHIKILFLFGGKIVPAEQIFSSDVAP